MVWSTSGAVQAALLQATLLLRRDLDVRWGEQEDLFGDALHGPAEPVGQAGGEVDQPPGQFAIDPLEVHDHRLVRLQLVSDLLSVVEPYWDDDVDLGRLGVGEGPDHRRPLLHRHAATATAAAHAAATHAAATHALGASGIHAHALFPRNGPHAGLLGLIGHVDRFGPTAAAPARGRRRRLRRGLVVRLVLLVLVVVDESQVHHGPSPDRCHPCVASLALRAYRRVFGATGRAPNSPRPTRTIVGPSSTATSRSSLIPMERSARPSWSAIAATWRKPGRASSGGPAGPTAMRPRTSRPM